MSEGNGEFKGSTIAQLTRIERAVGRIEQALFTGNGAPSVLARLAVLEERSPASKKFVAGTGGIIAALVVIANFLSALKQP